jgi:hypothetical protein
VTVERGTTCHVHSAVTVILLLPRLIGGLNLSADAMWIISADKSTHQSVYLHRVDTVRWALSDV